MSYYGTIALNMGLPFVTETIAYDLGSLCQRAAQIHSPGESRLLGILVGQEQLVIPSKPVPPGVLKAQAKLAAFYLFEQKPQPAAVVRDRLLTEPVDRLRTARDEMLRVEHEEFWEIVDRGYRDFDYVPPEHREHLRQLFGALDQAPTATA